MQTRQSQLDLGIRGVGVGAESPLPPLQAIDGGVPLAAHPLHYAESSPEAAADTNEEYKALPGKLGPAAAPMSKAQVRIFPGKTYKVVEKKSFYQLM